MPKKILADRVSLALNNIGDWRNTAKSQGATHLLPMLALIERGAGDPPGKATLMNETPHEFEFWDKYFKLNDGKAATAKEDRAKASTEATTAIEVSTAALAHE